MTILATSILYSTHYLWIMFSGFNYDLKATVATVAKPQNNHQYMLIR